MTRIIIRAIKDRTNYIGYLKEMLPQAEWCFDQKRDAMDTFVRAMRMANNEPTIHLEEDVVLTDNFVAKIEAEIAKHPDSIIQFFSMRNDDIKIGSRWDNHFRMNQCFYIPAGYGNELADYLARWKRRDRLPNAYDVLMDDWLAERKEKYWISVPSLVEHRIGTSQINPRRFKKRISKTFEA